MNTPPSWPECLSTDERIERAEKKIEAAIDNVMAIIQVNAANQIINRSARLSSQVPLSRAGVAYRVFAREMMRGEILRLCTLWDKTSEDRNSLPTIAKLVDNSAVRGELWKRADGRIRNGREFSAENDDPKLLNWIQRASDEEVKCSESDFLAELDGAFITVEETIKSPLLKPMIYYRDVHLAHSLDEKAKPHPEQRAKNGDVAKLLSVSIDVLGRLNSIVRGASFDWDGSFRIEKRNAKALWHGVTIEVLE